MSFIKTGFTLAVGVVVGIAIKSIKDMEKDVVMLNNAKRQEKDIIALLDGRYYQKVEYAIVTLTMDVLHEKENKQQLWEEGISAVVYGQCLVELNASHYSDHIKAEVAKELDVLFERFKECRLESESFSLPLFLRLLATPL